jgi:hypothetical protein
VVLTAMVVGAILAGVSFIGTRNTERSKRRRAIRGARLWSIADFPASKGTGASSRFPMFRSWIDASALPDPSVGRIIGVVKQLERSVTAPLTGRSCVFYRVCAYESSELLVEECDGVAFELVDGSGSARIDPKNAMSVMTDSIHQRNSILEAATAEQVAFLERRGYKGTFLNIRYEEDIVTAGTTIAAVGFGSLNATTAQLELGSSPYLRLLLSNDPNATHLLLPEARARIKQH